MMVPCSLWVNLKLTRMCKLTVLEEVLDLCGTCRVTFFLSLVTQQYYLETQF